MIIDPHAITVFKNFAEINKSLEFRAGTRVLDTISESKNLRAQANMGDQWKIEQDFAIFDLNKLLSVIALAGKNPTAEVLEKQMRIKGNGEFLLTLTDPAHIVRPKKASVEMNPEISFHLPEAQLIGAIKAAGVLGHTTIAFMCDGNKMSIGSQDPDNPTSDRFTSALVDMDKPCNVMFSVDNLKLIPQDYMIAIDPEGISLWTGQSIAVKYYVSINIESTFG